HGAVQDRDLGAVGRDVARIVDATRPHLPRGSFLTVRGQLATMRTAYVGLLAGLGFSIVLVYLLIVVNFQSWLDLFIIVCALQVGSRTRRWGGPSLAACSAPPSPPSSSCPRCSPCCTGGARPEPRNDEQAIALPSPGVPRSRGAGRGARARHRLGDPRPQRGR